MKYTLLDNMTKEDICLFIIKNTKLEDSYKCFVSEQIYYKLIDYNSNLIEPINYIEQVGSLIGTKIKIFIDHSLEDNMINIVEENEDTIICLDDNSQEKMVSVDKACEVFRRKIIKINPAYREFPTALDDIMNDFKKELLKE